MIDRFDEELFASNGYKIESTTDEFLNSCIKLNDNVDRKELSLRLASLSYQLVSLDKSNYKMVLALLVMLNKLHHGDGDSMVNAWSKLPGFGNLKD